MSVKLNFGIDMTKSCALAWPQSTKDNGSALGIFQTDQVNIMKVNKEIVYCHQQ